MRYAIAILYAVCIFLIIPWDGAKSRVKSRFDNKTIDLQEAATKSMIDDLESRLKEYDERKAGHYQSNLDLVDAIPVHLIKARIAVNWIHKDLSRQIGTSEQQIQHYESTDYESASLATIKHSIPSAFIGKSERPLPELHPRLPTVVHPPSYRYAHEDQVHAADHSVQLRLF